MSIVPRVTALVRERVCREFDNRGPDACIVDAMTEMERTNPELLKLAKERASALGTPSRLMSGFAMFYCLLMRAWPTREEHLSALPQVTVDTLRRVEAVLRQQGSKAFLADTLDDLERNNPELLAMTHAFAERQADYLGVMQAFALLYRALVDQSDADRAYLH